MDITYGTADIIVLLLISVGLILFGMVVGVITTKLRSRNPIKELKEDTIYFQDELDSSHLLLRKSKEDAELKLYKIKGADRTKMPKVFAVTDKDKDIYKIVSYEPTTIGESLDGLPDELAE